MSRRRITLALMAFASSSLLFFTPALADCLIAGSVSAAPNPTPSGLGSWEYTLSVTWDTGTRYALSHFNLLIAHQGGSCNCLNLDQALNWLNPIGISSGEPASCSVTYAGFLECNGDPSLDLTDLLLKFEPVESADCAPSTTGQGTYVFFSDYPPAPISEPNLSLVDKFGRLVCYGPLTGVFPGLPCDPTATEARSWGSQKATYR